MLVHEKILTHNELTDAGICYVDPGAKDRRAIVRLLYGDWFEVNRLKLTRDYMVRFAVGGRIVHHSTTNVIVTIEVKDPTKAVLFKLTWGGK